MRFAGCVYTKVALSPTCLSMWPLGTSVHARVTVDLVSQASPIPFRSADRVQYRHEEEGSGDLGPLYMNSWNPIIGQE